MELSQESLTARQELLESARVLISAIADFENMTDSAAKAMRDLRTAVKKFDGNDWLLLD